MTKVKRLFVSCMVFLCYALVTNATTSKTTDWSFQLGGINYKITSSSTVAITYDYYYYWSGTYDSDSYYVSGYSGNVTIPSTVTYGGTTYTVTSIAAHAFDDASVTSVTLPSSITKIDSYAFTCATLTEITIPSSVTSIGASAFSGCAKLVSLEIGSGVKTIATGAFSNCTALLQIRSKATTPPTLASGAFSSSILSSASLVVPTGCKSAYSSATSWSSFASISETAKTWSATRASGLITSNTAGAALSLSTISAYEWDWDSTNKRLQSTNYDVNSSTSLSTATITTTSSSIFSFDYAVSSEYSDKLTITLDGITIVNGISGTTSGKFNQIISKGTHTLVIKYVKDSSVKANDDRAYISNMQFKACADVSSSGSCGINSESNVKWYKLTDGDLYFIGTGEMINPSYPSESKWEYDKTIKDVYIMDGITSVGNYTFYCSSIESVSLPNTLKTIGKGAFYHCRSLTSIDIPNSVTSIGEQCFMESCDLIYAKIGDGVTSLPAQLFDYCPKLVSVTLGKNITSISTDATFNYCFKLFEINNYSKLQISKGSTDYGRIGLYAKVIHTSENEGSSIKEYNNYIFLDTNDTTLLIGCKFKNAALNLPTSLNGNVYDIADYAFYDYDCSSASDGYTSLTIPECVKHIGAYAFQCSYDMKYVTISKGVESIGIDAFSYCNSLTKVNITDITKWCSISFGNSSANPLACAKNLYLNGSQKTSITFASNIKNIGAYAFYNCTSLTSITVPSTTTVGREAFYGTGWYKNQSDGLIYINTMAYAYKGAMPASTALSLKVGTTEMTAALFKGQTNLASITLPSSLTSISDNCFYGCTGLTNLSIPANVKTIGTAAFNGCTGLKSISIPKNVTKIDDSAFAGCTGLTSVILNNASSIEFGEKAFSGCSAISKVCIYDMALWCGNSFATELSNPLYYSKKLYVNGMQATSLTIPNTVKSIGQYAFYNNTGSTSVTIPTTIETIGSKAFYNNSSLTSVDITNSDSWCGISFEDLYANPLYYAKKINLNGSALTDLVVSDEVASIGDYAFYNCTDLTSVSLGAGLKTLGNEVFTNDTKIAKLYSYATTPATITASTFNTVSTSTPLYIPEAKIANYYDAACWSSFTNMIPLSDYTITYKVDNEIYKKEIYTEGSIIKTLDNPTKDGYTFSGWTGYPSNMIMPAEDITVTGYFTINSIYAASISINKQSLTINVGGSCTLTATLSPDNVTNKTVTWFSNNTSVATVNETGLVTTLAEGTATITATTADGTNLSASCVVTVTEKSLETTDISQMSDVLYSAEKKVKAGGQIILPIYLKNSAAVTLFQTNVYLPEGFSFAKKTNGKYAVSLIKDRITDEDDNHVISANLQDDGSLLILCSSQDNYTFDGNDGQVATVTIDVNDDTEEGQYLIKLNNQKMVKPDNTGNNVATYQVVTTVKNFTLGDVNDDGEIDGYDLVGISNLILNTNTDGLNRDAADVNQDGDVDGYDYVMEVNTILGTNVVSAKATVNTVDTENDLSSLILSPMTISTGKAQMNVGMKCDGDVFTLVQSDIKFPKGVEPVIRNGRAVVKLAEECLKNEDNHTISCVKQNDGTYRVLIMSQDNIGFNGKNGQLFTIDVETKQNMNAGKYDIVLSNTKLVRANNTGVNPSDYYSTMTYGDVTGISDISNDADENESPKYNLNGQRISKTAQQGIYISNGKKYINK